MSARQCRRGSRYRRGAELIPDGRRDSGTSRVDDRVAVFVDHSNLRIGLLDAAFEQWEYPAVRLEFSGLRRLLAGGREVADALVVADAETSPGAIAAMRRARFEVLLRERGRLSGTEQANDEALQVRTYELIHRADPCTLVLATGDGAGAFGGRGFIPALEAARDAGWAIEIGAWSTSLNRHLRDSVLRMGGAVVVLDDYYFGISEVPGLRVPSTVSLIGRPMARASRLDSWVGASSPRAA